MTSSTVTSLRKVISVVSFSVTGPNLDHGTDRLASSAPWNRTCPCGTFVFQCGHEWFGALPPHVPAAGRAGARGRAARCRRPARHGLGASLAEIAAAAGVGRTTVHRAFPTRGDLLTALALEAVDRLTGALTAARLDDGPATDVLARVVEEVLPLADELAFLDSGPEVWDLPQMRDAWWSVTASLDSLVQRGQLEGDIRATSPPRSSSRRSPASCSACGTACATVVSRPPPRRATS